MVLSMTGFGSTTLSENGFSAEVEIKCLNSKFLDFNLRIPKSLNSFEAEIRELFQKELARGKVNLSIDWREMSGDKSKVLINKDLLKSYYQELNQVKSELDAESNDLFKIALGMPDVIESSDDEGIEEKWELTKKALKESIQKVNQFRSTEGKKLEDALKDSLMKIGNSLEKVRKIAPERSKAIRSKLSESIKELEDKNIDKNRFEQELIYYLEKLDIEEEMVRLDTHLKHFDEVLGQASNGKRLNFISQEMGREINTLGAKANNSDIQKSVVDMKEELEKIREQVQNIL